jgi:hypothetical protein
MLMVIPARPNAINVKPNVTGSVSINTVLARHERKKIMTTNIANNKPSKMV